MSKINNQHAEYTSEKATYAYKLAQSNVVYPFVQDLYLK